MPNDFMDAIAKDISATIRASVKKEVDSFRETFEKLMSESMSEIKKSILDESKQLSGDNSFKMKAFEETFLQVIKELPKPEKGEDGKSPSADEVAKSMQGLFDSWALGFERKADAIFEKAIDRMPKPKDGLDGKNALELKDLSLELMEDGRTLKMVLDNGESKQEKEVRINTILDKGVFNDKAEYQNGDAVTFGGCLWISQKDFPEGKPGATNDWRLAVKKGRDGRETVKLVPQAQVKVA